MQHLQDVIAQGNCPSFGTRCPAAGSSEIDQTQTSTSAAPQVQYCSPSRTRPQFPNALESVAISDLIVAELRIEERLYVVSDGEVYRVDDGFLKRLDDELERIPWSTFPFPDYQDGNEPDYIEAVSCRAVESRRFVR